MSSLPPGWAETTMGEVCQVVSGSTPKTSVSSYWNGDIPWITPDDLSRHNEKYIDRGTRSITKPGYDSCSTRMVPAGTVLYTTRAPIGYVAIAAQPVCTNQGFKNFVPPEGILSEYLYWYLHHVTPAIQEMGSGTTFKEVSGKVARTIPLPLPPSEEQRQIVHAIEEQLSRLDVGRRSLNTARQRLDLLRSSILTTAFSAKDLAWVTLADVAQIRRELVNPSGYQSLPHVAPNHIEGRTGRLLPFQTVGEDGVMSPKFLFGPGDVLYSKIRPYLAKAAMVDFEGLCSADMYPLTTDLLPRFLHLWLISPRFTALVAQQQGRSILPKINREALFRLPVPYAEGDRQREVVSYLDQQFSILETLRVSLEVTLRRADSVLQAILRDGFEGELVPQNPYNEPAATLIERIRTGRGNA